jgi:hypothetical protein
MAKLLDIIGTSEAQRSLVFVDACRQRLTEDRTRAVAADPSTMLSTLYGRMKHIRGQAILFAAAAGQYAFDGNGNGVFTKAVIDGLHCNAAAPRGAVTAETLSSYVDRSVREWMRTNHGSSVAAGIQWSFDGEAKNMPLALCNISNGPVLDRTPIARVSIAGSTLTAFTASGAQLWQRSVEEPVTRAKVADLDADGQPKVVATTRTAILVFGRDGTLLWSAREGGMPLRSFAIGALLHKQTREIVALWDAAAASSRLTLYGANGQALATCDDPRRLDRIAIDRPTNRHAPKIVAAGIDASGTAVISLFHPRKLSDGKPLWSDRLAPHTNRIIRLRIVDYDGDGRNDIAVETADGWTFFIDFDGKVLGRSRG